MPELLCRAHMAPLLECPDPGCQEIRGHFIRSYLIQLQEEAWSDQRPLGEKNLRARKRVRLRRELRALL